MFYWILGIAPLVVICVPMFYGFCLDRTVDRWERDWAREDAEEASAR